MSDPVQKITRRVFLVGCPRSGTTLYQSFLAAHNQIISFPESHVFVRLLARRRWLGVLGLASRDSRRDFDRFLDHLGDQAPYPRLPRWAVTARSRARLLTQLLDQLTLDAGRSVWLEKTPDHVRAVEVIERYVPEPRFIHLVRNGPDVVASLYDVAQRYPQTWGQRSIDDCINQWNRAVQHTECHRHKPNHLVIRYEQLVTDTERVLRTTTDFLGLPFQPAMMQRSNEQVERTIVNTDEPWKAQATGQVRQDTGGKFSQLFDDQQQQSILSKLLPTPD